VELAPVDEYDGPLTDCPQYATPTKILNRADRREVSTVAAPRLLTKKNDSDPGGHAAEEGGDGDVSPQVSSPVEEPIAYTPPEPVTDSMSKSEIDAPPACEGEPEATAICYHEGGDLFAEDVEQHMAVLPEVSTSMSEVTIEDIQVGDPEHPPGDREAPADYLAQTSSADGERELRFLRPLMERSATSMWAEPGRLHKGVDQLPQDIERSCPILSRACCPRR
jgi:hypothetical protein